MSTPCLVPWQVTFAQVACWARFPASRSWNWSLTAADFLAGTAVAGAGFGLGFCGAFRMMIALATPSQSAGLVTAIFTVAYPSDGNPATTAKLRLALVPGGAI